MSSTSNETGFPSQKQELSDLKKQEIREHIHSELRRIIQTYEPWYIPVAENPASETTTLTRERYARFEAWLKQLATRQAAPANLDQQTFAQDVQRATKGYEALQALEQGSALSKEALQLYEWGPEWFQIKQDPILSWTRLPATEVLEQECGLASVAIAFYERRKFKAPSDKHLVSQVELRLRTGLDPTNQDLLNIGYALGHPAKRLAFLESVDPDRISEHLPPAKLFSVKEVIQRKKKLDPTHPNHLTSREVLEAFDEAGVRPANLRELLAYAKQFQRETPSDAPRSVYAPGSVSSNEERAYIRSIPFLEWDQFDGKCRLNTEQFFDTADSYWPANADYAFLVFRKT